MSVQRTDVVVIGSGQAGCQIAEELRRAGRPVYLSVGRSWWAPRRYRGRDMSLWLRDIGWFDRTVAGLPPGARAGLPNPQFTGSGGGRDLNVHTLAAEGVVLLGRLRGIHDGKLFLTPDLAGNLAWGDEQAAHRLHTIDEHVRERGLDAPAPDPPVYPRTAAELARGAPEELNLADAGIGAVVWATGSRPDLECVRLPVLDAQGYPVQRRGVTAVSGCSSSAWTGFTPRNPDSSRGSATTRPTSLPSLRPERQLPGASPFGIEPAAGFGVVTEWEAFSWRRHRSCPRPCRPRWAGAGPSRWG